MPLYDYECRACGHGFEIRQPFSDEALTECPQCGGEIRRVIAPVGIVFKGGGYYVTDTRKQRKAGGAGDSKGSAAAESGTAAGSEASSDKPAVESGSAGSTSGAADPAPAKAPAKGAGDGGERRGGGGGKDPGGRTSSGDGEARSGKPKA